MFFNHFENQSISRWFGEVRIVSFADISLGGTVFQGALSSGCVAIGWFLFWDLCSWWCSDPYRIQVKNLRTVVHYFCSICVCVLCKMFSHQQYHEDVWKLGMALQYNYSRLCFEFTSKICRFHPQERGPDRRRGYSQGVGSSSDWWEFRSIVHT